jgi:Leucine-rich repeat (LRR) protein
MLQVLSMAGNQFTGSLAPLESCTALRDLDLSCNQLTGSLEPLQGCTALHELDLYGNKLSGSLEPLQLSGIMLQLTGFDLRGHQLTAGGL